ncbi:MAG: ornithine cyclodeaminase family protein [Phycisphaeraceae bacterium]
MKILSAEDVHAALAYPDLVDALQSAYAGSFSMPPRQVFLLDDEPSNHDAFAVLPSWNDELIAVKSFTYFPDNPKPEYASLYSKILLFDRKHGEPLALVDGTSVTFWRTAGISGLASRLLSREDSKTLLLLGTGNLAPYIIKAQLSVRPIDRVMVWGRTPENAQAIAEQSASENESVRFEVADDLEAACSDADIIVSATGSHEPLVLGDWVTPGTHTDFIGNHHATKRECDTALVVKSKVYADSYVNCFKEAGELLVPIAEGAITKDHVVGELTEMCSGAVKLRDSDDEVTLFKSIGMALSDLVGAGAAYRSAAQNLKG